jgi:stage II sporulation protein D
LRNDGSDYFFASHVYILAGDEVRIIEREGEARLLEVIYPSHSNIMDRSSPFNRWELRISQEALEKRINKYYPVGKLEDIIPQRRGNSQRVVEVLIKGGETQTVVKGLRIRRVLGLKETLFVIDREYDTEGRITHFTFYGRGFGHGVGLCQVGAFGMAQAGAGYKEILKKYYRGIKISKKY